jgi:tetratricopeptide (TPR) repeat protein
MEQPGMIVGRKGARLSALWQRVALAACAAALAGTIAGCPPSRPTTSAHLPVAGSNEPPPPIGTPPATDGIFIPLNLKLPLAPAAQTKATMSLDAVQQQALKAATALGATPAATAPATTAPADEPDSSSLAVKYYLQGRDQFLAGSTTQAMESLDKALQLDPNSFAIMRLMGRVCFAAGQLPRGSLYLQRAAVSHPDDVDVNLLLGRYWLERKEWDAAIHYLLRANASPDLTIGSAMYPLVSFYLARGFQGGGYLQLAGQQYETFLTEISEPRPAYRYDRELNYLIDQDWAVELAAAECFSAAGDLRSSLKHYQTAMEHRPDQAYLVGQVVLADVKANEFPDAIAAALNHVNLSNASEESVNLLMWVYRRAGLQDKIIDDLETRSRAESDTSAATLALAAVQEKLGQKAAAVTTLGRYMHAKPGDMAILTRLVALAKQADAYGPGFNALAAALRATPGDNPQILEHLWNLFGRPPTQDALAAVVKDSAEDRDTQANYLLGLLYVAFGDEAQAGRLLERAIVQRPDYWPAREAYVSLLLEQEQFVKAQKVVQDAVALKQGGADARRLMIESEMAQNRYTNALKLAQDAKADFPESPDVRLLVASIYIVREQPTEAATELRELIARFPKFELGYERLINLDLRVRQNTQEALETLAALLHAVPQSHYGLTLSAQYYSEVGRADDAEQLLQKLMNESPNDATLTVEMANVRKNAGKPNDAIKLLQDYLAHKKPEPVVVQALAGLYDTANRKDESLALFEKYYKANPESEIWLVAYGAALSRAGHNNDAEAVFRQGVQRYPKSSDIVDTYAQFLAQNERPADAVAVLQAFIDHNGPTAERLYKMVNLQEEAGQHDQAVATLQRILVMMPDHTGANNDLGYFWADKGIRLDEAEKLIRKALYNEPNNPQFVDSLAWVHYKKGDFAKAVEELSQAVSAPKGQEPELIAHLGDALYRLGKKDEAREHYEQAKALMDQKEPARQKTPDGVHIYTVLRQIKEGATVELPPLGKAEDGVK